MKKSSWTKTTKSYRIWQSSWWLYPLGFAVVVLALWFLAPGLIAKPGSLFITPTVTLKSWLSESSATFPSYFRDRNQLIAENQALEQAVIENQLAAEAKRWLEEENDELKLLLGNRDMKRLAAGVIGRPTDTPYDVLLIDRGRSDGVRPQAPVFVGSDQAIGFVGAVYEHSAVVILVTTPGVTSTVYIYGPNIYTTAVGMGGGTLRVSVPQGIELSEGNLVVMPALNGGLYGPVSVVDSVASRPEQYGYVSMPLSLQSLHYVGVDIRPLESIDFAEARAVVEQVRTDFLEVAVPEEMLIDAPVDVATTSAATSTNDSI